MLAWPTSIFLFYDFRNLPIPTPRRIAMVIGILAAFSLSIAVFHLAMKRGIRALTELAS